MDKKTPNIQATGHDYTQAKVRLETLLLRMSAKEKAALSHYLDIGDAATVRTVLSLLARKYLNS